MTKKVLSIVGARPQFIKAAAVSRAIAEAGSGLTEVMVHTGQHFDDNMSKVFFDELEIAQPRYNLEISGGHHGQMTGRMLEAIEQVLMRERPDWVLIYGDTNSTLAGALAAAKLHIPVAHIEAGLRSFNMRMPEEINRILADRVSSLLFCPTETAVANLKREGIESGVQNVGDVMYDVALYVGARAREASDVMQRLGLSDGSLVLATCHRAENTDDPKRLSGIVRALAAIAQEIPVVLPLHPRTRNVLEQAGQLAALGHVELVQPLSFLDMAALEQAAKVIVTDSGGVQKEAFFYGVPCVTMRDETEWVETVELGWNTLVGADEAAIVAAANRMICFPPQAQAALPYGTGNASSHIAMVLRMRHLQ